MTEAGFQMKKRKSFVEKNPSRTAYMVEPPAFLKLLCHLKNAYDHNSVLASLF